MKTKTRTPNKAERRKAALLAHYATCERLAALLGAPCHDGKKISIALWNLEKKAHAGATAHCNGESLQCQFYASAKMRATMPNEFDFCRDENAWERFADLVKTEVGFILGQCPASFFVNGDARGYALKIDNETPEGRALIGKAKLHTDWGGYGILSPEIDGD